MAHSKEFSNLRCTICNHVSHAEIADDLGEWSSSSFYPDGEFGYVCFECQSGIDEVMHDYYLDDEIDERILDEE